MVALRAPRFGPFAMMAVAAVAVIVVVAPWLGVRLASTAIQPIKPNLREATTTVDSGVVALFGNFARDGKVTFRPSTGEWTWTDNEGVVLTYQWGQAGDIPVVGDYNGNAAVDDLALWRPSNGTWYIWYDAGRGIQVVKGWGQPGDIPVVGDFNANSVHDLTVFRPSTGIWWIWYDGAIPRRGGCQPAFSTFNCQTTVGWGAPGDVPVSGNFNTWGADDLAVWRPSEGKWHIWYDAGKGAQVARNWGLPGDLPMPGRYGSLDGTTDLAVYRPSTGSWWIWHNGGGATPGTTEERSWGHTGDIPVRWGPRWPLIGNYCANATVNCPAVFRPSTGTWLIANPGGRVLMAPEGYTFCAFENSFCNTTLSSVAFGADGMFNYRTVPAGTLGIQCDTATFGDPIPGVGKACFVKRSAS
ncbi:MAG TPA: hypothetical protein VF062_03455 [Candidatus Limnocylindrales bacterium]